MSHKDDQNSPPNRRDVLVGLGAGVAATTLPGPAVALPGNANGPGNGNPAQGNPALDAQAAAMSDVIVGAWNAWLVDAEYTDSAINSVTLEGGELSSPVDVKVLVEDGLIVDGIDPATAEAFATAADGAWAQWAADWTLPPSDAFPGFAAVAAPEAPETEAQAVLLQPESSASYDKISTGLQGQLASAVAGKGPIKGNFNISSVVHSVAWRVGQRIAGWSASAMVEGIRGGGPVPTFAPPYVPVGPVVAGDNISTPGHLMSITPIPGGSPIVIVKQPPTKYP
ncbi:MAG: hypothetical protein KDA24_13225 [Deltaproteobacteria bacterium]|nr:hypothetical protein [Deltaproteobacteria bacterium]